MNTAPTSPAEGADQALSPAQLQEKIQQGAALHHKGQLESADSIYKSILQTHPNHFDALQLSGLVAQQAKNSKRAIELLTLASRINPNFPAVHINLGLAWGDLGEHERAVQCYAKAIVANPNMAEAYYNWGNACLELRQISDALKYYDKAIALNAHYAKAYCNRGVALSLARRNREAIESFDQALEINPELVEAYVKKAETLRVEKDHASAASCYLKALTVRPDADGLLEGLAYTKLNVCSWDAIDTLTEQILKRISEGGLVVDCFPLLALTQSAAMQHQAAVKLVQFKFASNGALGAIPKRARRKKICIGYFSSDFLNHPMTSLMAQVFEIHNREGFKVIAFSTGLDVRDAMRKRVEAAFDKFVDVRNKSDRQIAEMARSMGVDIAVDLTGFGGEPRAGIFALRAAPVQVNYLGYPATSGAVYMDYIIADSTLIPSQSQAHYTEKIVRLPQFQANDRQREISEKVWRRDELGLPDVGFVFCCFCNSYKFNPATFDSWMRILVAVQGSVLFLYANDETSVKNLRAAAQARGVDPGRLVFGKRVPNAEYLARYRSADLFLDTFPFNGGATVSDALWAGLPVVTRTGEAFASRMATSLLKSVGLDEMVAGNVADYEALAIGLAHNAQKLLSIKAKLQDNRLTSALFDSVKFTHSLEQAYTQMWNRYQLDLPPEHLFVDT